jgi:hypothetical protein
MKRLNNIKKILQSSYLKNLKIPAGMEMDKRILGDALTAMEISKKELSATKQPNIWRNIMKNQKTTLATAAAIIIAIILSISVLDKSTPSVYAVEQTIDAIKDVKTVYMTGEFYMQGRFECWMKYDGNPDKPTHVWLGRTGHNLCKICSPDGVFGFNKRTNRVHFARRDERNKDWILKFGSFFKDAVKKASKTDSVNIYNEKDPNTGKEIIVVHIKTSNREQKFIVNSETKLPIKFTTIRDDAPMEMMRKTLAVKNLTEIHYNEQPPEGIFDLPADAEIVTEEVDCMVDPDSGLIVGDMTHEQACLEIAKQTGQALVDIDKDKLCKLDLFFRLWPPQIWEQVRKMKEDGQWVKEVVITGEPYQEGQLWYVPMEIRSQTGQNEIQNAMIKFYEMEGKTFCFIIGSKEKGVVD